MKIPARNFTAAPGETIGAEYRWQDVLKQIIAQVDDSLNHHDLLKSGEDEELLNYLCRCLEHRRYIIMLDDVRDMQLVHYLRISLPNRCDGSVVFLTSNLNELIPLSDYHVMFKPPLQYFNENFNIVLRSLMFRTELVPPEMEEAGKKIVENCRGYLFQRPTRCCFYTKKLGRR